MIFHENPSSESQVIPGGWMDGQTGMRRLIVAFCNFVNMPKICKLRYNIQWHKFPNLQWRNMTRLCYEKHHNMMLLSGLPVSVLCLPKWPPPHTQYSLFRTIPVHNMFLCIIVKQPLSENDLVKNVFYFRKYNKSNVYSL
jgi:hypothetical protein